MNYEYDFMKGYYNGNLNDTKMDEVKLGKTKNTYIQWLVTRENNAPYAMRKFTIKPEGFIQMHYHDYVETLFILNGECKTYVDDDLLNLKKGDYIFIDTKHRHKIINTGKEDLEFICVIDYPDNMDIIPVDEE